MGPLLGPDVGLGPLLGPEAALGPLLGPETGLGPLLGPEAGLGPLLGPQLCNVYGASFDLGAFRLAWCCYVWFRGVAF